MIWTWLRRALYALLALVVLYLVAANVFLNTGLAPKLINRKPEKIRVTWEGGWTVIPGVARLWGIELRGQSKVIQWYATLDEVSVRSQLLPLADKDFRAGRIRGRGLTFYLRNRLPPDATEAERAAPMPPIPGLSNPPDPPPEAIYPPPPADREPWLIDLEGIEIEAVRELWIEQYRYAGDGRLAGDFRFELRGPMSVENVTLELRDGDLVAGETALADAVAVTIDASLEPIVPRETDLGEVLRFLDARVRLASPRTRFDFLDRYFRNTPWLDVDGEGAIEADAGLERGRLAAGSRVALSEATFGVDYLDYEIRGGGRIEAKVDDEGTEAVLDAVFDAFEVAGETETPYLRGSGLAIRARTPELDVLALEPEIDVAMTLPPSEIVDVAVYNAYLPPRSGFKLRSGTGTLQGRMAMSTVTGSGSGNFQLDASRIRVGFGDVDMVGNVKLESELADADPEARRFDLSGTRVALTDVVVVDGDKRSSRGWWGRVRLRDGEVFLTKPMRLDARVDAEVRDSRPLITLFAEKKPILGWMKPILTIEDLDLETRLRMTDDALLVQDLLLTGKGLEVRADLRFGNRPEGFFFVKRGMLSAAAGLDDGERDWKLFKSRKWYEKQTGKPAPKP